MLVERRLDFRRVNIRPSSNNHIGAPVRKVQIAIRVEPTQIAYSFPAVVRFSYVTEVVIRGSRATSRHEVDLADLARGAITVVLVENSQTSHIATSDRALMEKPFVSAQRRSADALRGTVHFP